MFQPIIFQYYLVDLSKNTMNPNITFLEFFILDVRYFDILKKTWSKEDNTTLIITRNYESLFNNVDLTFPL